MQLFFKIRNGIANSVDPDQTAPLGLLHQEQSDLCTVCICHFVRNFEVPNLGYLLYISLFSRVVIYRNNSKYWDTLST